jgi:hypothetical protein
MPVPLTLPTRQDLQESVAAMREARLSCARPSRKGLAYLRELRAHVAAQGVAVERLAKGGCA